MATEKMFSTPREDKLTGDQMLESIIMRRKTQRQNLQALKEANKLIDNSTDFVSTMESENLSIEENIKKESAMENSFYANGTRNLAKQKLGMKYRLVEEGTEELFDRAIATIIYESYWLDNSVKESTFDQIEESINSVLNYIEENCSDSKVSKNNQSRLLENLHILSESFAKEVSERIVREADEQNTASNTFELLPEEEEKFDEKLCDLGKDEIVSLIKDKVAHVIQDEKEKGKERSETFVDIEKATSDEETEEDDDDIDDIDDDKDEDDDTDDEVKESVLNAYESGEITLEGATWNTIKIIISEDKKKAVKAYKTAAKHLKAKNYKEAAKEYEIAKSGFLDLKKQLQNVDDTVGSAICSYLLSGWLQHAFVATLGGGVKGGTGQQIAKGVCVVISARFRLFIPYTIVQAVLANYINTDNDKKSNSSTTMKIEAIAALDANIKLCDEMIKQCKAKKSSVKEALLAEPTDNKYTHTEKYIANVLENTGTFNAFDDPSWNEFKSYVSLMCKKIQNILLIEKYSEAKILIDELSNKLTNVTEDVPSDIKSFIMAMVSMIYGAVPSDEVIISRMNSSLGSPDLQSSEVNYATLSWMDLFVNIKTNLESIKGYCDSRIDSICIEEPGKLYNNSNPFENTLESLIIKKQNQILNRNIGNTLFESLMLSNIASTEKAAMESSNNFNPEDVEDAALIESLLQYTVFETLDTLGIYKFRLNDIRGVKKNLLSSVSEGTSPIYGDSDYSTMSSGTGKNGRKKVRINTRKYNSGLN